MKRLLAALLAGSALAGCNSRLSQEEAQQRIEKYLTANVKPPSRYEPISTQLLDVRPNYDNANPGSTWALHRYTITDGEGQRQEREDTVIITAQDSIRFR